MATWSESRLSTWERCPRQYRFRYLERVEVAEAPEPIQMVLGQRVHEALEHLYRALLAGRRLDLAALLDWYRRRWTAAWPARVDFPEGPADPAPWHDLGLRYLGDYYRRHQPFDGERMLAVERELLFPLDAAGRVPVRGYIDRLALSPAGVWRICDYKTAVRLPTRPELDGDRQLGLYQLGVQHAWPEARRVELVWHYLAHDLELTSTRTPAQLADLRREVLELVERIEADRDHPTRVGRHCDWCAYQPQCPAWRHPLAVAGLAPADRAADPGVALVDRYAALKAEAERVGRELDQARADLVAFAAERGLDAVAGSRHTATVRTEPGLRWPGPGHPARPALEALLQAEGRWAEVTALSPAALGRALAGWPAALAEGVRRFAEACRTVRVRLRSRAARPRS